MAYEAINTIHALRLIVVNSGNKMTMSLTDIFLQVISTASQYVELITITATTTTTTVSYYPTDV